MNFFLSTKIANVCRHVCTCTRFDFTRKFAGAARRAFYEMQMTVESSRLIFKTYCHLCLLSSLRFEPSLVPATPRRKSKLFSTIIRLDAVVIVRGFIEQIRCPVEPAVPTIPAREINRPGRIPAASEENFISFPMRAK